ncbi:hypothetical protein U9M48_040455 [Paspalum notatum var. saurae]|uniref:Uncharacterized protein n=1 Tax=Paspalum notatum var. saurae TaxID=547442 RepID=A0AAQ3UM38_PASNO
MDNKVEQQRAELYRILTQVRLDMDQKLALQRAELNVNIREERLAMDRKLKEECDNTDRRVKEERDNSDRRLNEERDMLDRKLRKERQNMDRIIEFERVRMERLTLQARVDMEHKLQEQHNGNGKNKIEHQVMIMNADIDQPTAQQDRLGFENFPRPDVVMEFKVHSRDRDPGHFRVLEPGTVDWVLIANQLKPYGYKGKAEVYYRKRGFDSTGAKVLIEGAHDVEQMMIDLEGTKECDLFVVNNPSPSSSYTNTEDDFIDGVVEVQVDFIFHLMI